jgi:hypothetical protein
MKNRAKALASFTIILIAATLAWASGDPWKTKPSRDWNEQDISSILRSSPWAKTDIQASGAWRPMGSSTTSGVGMYTRGTVVVDGGATKEQEAIGGVQLYTVLWWSSRTIRAASARRAVLHRTMTADDAQAAIDQGQDDYQILVESNKMSIFEKRGEKAFENAAYLESKKSKRQIVPSGVTFQLNSKDEVVGVIFHFPKKSATGEPSIAADEREIDFFLRVGDSKVTTYFDPTKMIDKQGPDL